MEAVDEVRGEAPAHPGRRPGGPQQRDGGVETLPWDGWLPLAGVEEPGSPSEDELALLDAVAAATDDEARRLFEDPRLTPPREIPSLAPYLGLRKVTLP
ncbi:hypothetical protein ABZZ74_05580 [Streptomyces sp. NPDC006476]|uniref:hypothetical protein n=1 Tax=Streptomyces sp. NPDC006476 TaxID=3157175 RepID=UPI0033B92338